MEIDPQKGKSLGVVPTKDGKYLIPPQAVGSLLKPVEPKEPTNAFELWHKQNPNAPASEWLAQEAKQKPEVVSEYRDFREGYMKNHPNANGEDVVKAFATEHKAPATAAPGTLSIQWDPKSSSWVTFNNKTGEFKPTELGKLSGTEAGVKTQANAIKSTGDDLISEIRK